MAGSRRRRGVGVQSGRPIAALPARVLALAATFVVGFVAAPAAGAEAQTAQRYAPGELIVGFEEGAGAAQRQAAREALAATDAERLMPGTQLVRVGGEEGVAAAAARARALPGVAYATPNRIVRPAEVIPDDPGFFAQWGLRNTGQKLGERPGLAGADTSATVAWETQMGAPGIVVAVVDSGIDLDHEDLVGGLWVNEGEIPGNGVDDEGNGFVDDRRGWDFWSRDNDPDDPAGHGTHVAGIVGARASNGLGMAGIAPAVTLMAVRYSGPKELGTEATLAAGLRYAADNGAQIVNLSVSGIGRSPALRDVVGAHPRTLFVAAAGNDSARIPAPSYDPCTIPKRNVICVASTDYRDGLSSFSNYGLSQADLGAPGTLIFSTLPDDFYELKSGTSMATPMVAGAAAILLSERPELAPSELRAILLDSADPRRSLAGITVSGGRLNLAAALGEVDDPPVLRPQTEIISGPPRRTRLRRARFTLAADRAGASFRCRLDGGGWVGCCRRVGVEGLSPGRHTLRAVARADGMRDPDPARWTWRVRRERSAAGRGRARPRVVSAGRCGSGRGT